MTKTTYNKDSLSRHGVSEEEADEVLARGVWFPLDPSERGNDRLMFVGFTLAGRLLEVGVEYFDAEDREHIFHANDAAEPYRKAMEQRTKI